MAKGFANPAMNPGKGAGKDGKPAKGAGKGQLPAGAKAKASDGRFICFAHNRGQSCAKNPCPMAHICWFCEAAGGAAGIV